jgi:hypothetical protein
MKETQRNCSQQKSRELGSGLRKATGTVSGIEMNESWIMEATWTSEPTPETVKRLIKWFSDEKN